MKRNWVWVIFFAGLFLCLSGCMFRGTDELFALPRTSETNQKLQEKVQSVIGTSTGISPVSGSNTQTLQLVDLDRDGVPEAVAFYRDSSTERPLKIAIFKQDVHGDYSLYAQIEGAGTDIESIEYRNLVQGAELEILVSWQVSPTVHTLVAYGIQQNQVSELMRSGYTRYVSSDLNGDGRAELMLIQLESSDLVGNRVDLYTAVSDAMEFHSSAPLSEGILALQLWDTGVLTGGVPALMVTSEYAENKYITDIFCMSQTGLRNISLDENTRISSRTLRQYTGVLPADINKDGLTEIPITKSIPTYKKSGSENFWQITWLQFAKDGSQKAVLSTYHNNSDRWYLQLPDNWLGQITLSRQEQTSSGERAVVFSYWKGDPNTPPVPFLTIYRLTGNNRGNNASQNKRFTLLTDADTIYAAEFLDSTWNCGIDRAKLIELFHPM